MADVEGGRCDRCGQTKGRVRRWRIEAPGGAAPVVVDLHSGCAGELSLAEAHKLGQVTASRAAHVGRLVPRRVIDQRTSKS